MAAVGRFRRCEAGQAASHAEHSDSWIGVHRFSEVALTYWNKLADGVQQTDQLCLMFAARGSVCCRWLQQR